MSAKTKILIVTDRPVLPTGLAETTRLALSGNIQQVAPLSDIYLWLHMNDEANIAWPKAYF